MRSKTPVRRAAGPGARVGDHQAPERRVTPCSNFATEDTKPPDRLLGAIGLAEKPPPPPRRSGRWLWLKVGKRPFDKPRAMAQMRRKKTLSWPDRTPPQRSPIDLFEVAVLMPRRVLNGRQPRRGTLLAACGSSPKLVRQRRALKFH